MKRLKGFTLVELVITIAIVIILSVVSVPIYRNYTDKAKFSEGYALLGTILSAEKSYFSEYGYFYNNGGAVVQSHDFFSEMGALGISSAGNKYFTVFGVGADEFSTQNRYRFFSVAIIPEELRSDADKTVLRLDYNITKGSTISIANS